MTSFSRNAAGRAAAEKMMREFGHTNAGMPPRPGFPGRSPATPQAPATPGFNRNRPPPVQPPPVMQAPVKSGFSMLNTGEGISRGNRNQPAPGMGGRPPILGMRPPGMGTTGGGLPAPGMGGRPGLPMMKKGGKVSSASSRADGIAVKGKTKGKMV